MAVAPIARSICPSKGTIYGNISWSGSGPKYYSEEEVGQLLLDFSTCQPAGMYSTYENKKGLGFLYLAKIADNGWMYLAFPSGMGTIYAEWDRVHHRPFVRYQPDKKMFFLNFRNVWWQQCSATNDLTALYNVLQDEILPKLVKYGE